MKWRRLKAAIVEGLVRFSCRSDQLHSLRKQLEARNRELQALRSQLAQAQADLRQKPYKLRGAIAALFALSDKSLRATVRFPIWKALTGSGWEVVTDYCCLGGCDMDVYSFRTEREALLYTALLNAVGYQPMHNIACRACYEEYEED